MSHAQQDSSATTGAFLDELSDLVARTLESSGIDSDRARDAAIRVTDAVADSFGGIQFYIPVQQAKKTAARDAEILRSLEASGAAATAHSFGMAYGSVYAAARRARTRLEDEAGARK